jgi:adenylate cyclase
LRRKPLRGSSGRKRISGKHGRRSRASPGEPGARGVVFVDVGAPSIFPLEHIPGAVNLDLATALSRESLSRLVGKEDEVVFSCYGKHCPYSTVACAKALTWGFTHVFYFAGGFPAWKAAGYPLESRAGGD